MAGKDDNKNAYEEMSKAAANAVKYVGTQVLPSLAIAPAVAAKKFADLPGGEAGILTEAGLSYPTKGVGVQPKIAPKLAPQIVATPQPGGVSPSPASPASRPSVVPTGNVTEKPVRKAIHELYGSPREALLAMPDEEYKGFVDRNRIPGIGYTESGGRLERVLPPRPNPQAEAGFGVQDLSPIQIQAYNTVLDTLAKGRAADISEQRLGVESKRAEALEKRYASLDESSKRSQDRADRTFEEIKLRELEEKGLSREEKAMGETIKAYSPKMKVKRYTPDGGEEEVVVANTDIGEIKYVLGGHKIPKGQEAWAEAVLERAKPYAAEFDRQFLLKYPTGVSTSGRKITDIPIREKVEAMFAAEGNKKETKK